jgi:hypothetical protein
MATFDSTVIQRVANGLYNTQVGSATMAEALAAVNGNAYGSVEALANALYARDFGGMTDAAVAAAMVSNVGITGAALVAEATSIVTSALAAAPAGAKGATVVSLLNTFAGLTSNADFGTFATAFNAQVSAGVSYAQTAGTPDVRLDAAPSTEGMIFRILAGEAAGADVMRLTGDQDVRISFTNPANQVVGLDLDGDGVIEFNGLERSITGVAANFEIVDAYPRNPLDHTDTANNFLGDIYYDGTGFNGDGVSTNGNIALGGLGRDSLLAGTGNDFLAGGGVGSQNVPSLPAGRATIGDFLSGGRNADFMYGEFASLDNVDGVLTFFDGGKTADDTSAANGESPQDTDWILVEISDDEEYAVIDLSETAATIGFTYGYDTADLGQADGYIAIGDGKRLRGLLDDIENVDASGNLYGFLDDLDIELGGRRLDDRDASTASVGYNYGIGSSGQLRILGSDSANKLIGGFDNDFIDGADGNDLLMGGNLNFLNNPNLTGIWNNGRDELIGGGGSDDVVFETDGGIYEGGTTVDVDDDPVVDTLWLTREVFGRRTVTDVTTDGTVRIDLAVGKVGGLANAAGYGGADKAAATGTYTSDQTNYAAGYDRAQVQDFENVIATGLGAVDYLAAGANKPELQFANQQNHFAMVGNLDLRGTAGANTLYATGGNDVIEGRAGNDKLSGGDGNDDFYFFLQDGAGDGVDVIHRQTDANGDNLWDTSSSGAGLLERDFGQAGPQITANSKLTLSLVDNANPVDLSGFPVNGVVFKLDGVQYSISLTSGVQSTYAAFTAGLNTALDANATLARLNAVLNADNTITITDPNGKTFQTVGYNFVDNVVPSAGNLIWNMSIGDPSVTQVKDRLIYKSYEDRLDNEGVDDDSYNGSIISLGHDAYAEDLVINFQDEDADGLATTRLAEDQAYTVKFTNLTTQDKVTVTVNTVNYTLQVGIDLDGNIIAAEDGVGDTQAGIQTAFLTRLNTFINSFMDDDTSAGAINSAFNGVDTLTLTQRAYNGEETVFMRKPTVSLQNLSGGEPATATVTNVSQHEVELLDFDGRNNELNNTNVLFWGQEATQRATLETAKTAGGTITGKEAIVIDVGPNNLQDVIFGTTTAVPNNIATNTPLSVVPNGVAVHGDDFLLGGAGLDTINGGTGDDRVEGSVGGDGVATWDTLDGGKNFYAVQVLGEAQARVYVLNKWEAANPTKVTALQSLTISSITLIDQSESGTGTISGVFDDTLQFSQVLFNAGQTRFTVTLSDYTITGGVIELRNDGAGTVGVDMTGDGTIDNWTRFTNFENVRTVSGTGDAVAGGGQGNDTLNVVAMSNAVGGANGIVYNLTNNNVTEGAVTSTPGEVRYSADAHSNPAASAAAATAAQLTAAALRPSLSDFESLVIKVDGVENVIVGTGDDLLLIDETEAAKDNRFVDGPNSGDDRIEYLNDFGTDVAEPTVTIKVDNVTSALGGTDTVNMKGGRVGNINGGAGATDTLIGIEFITLGGNTAEGVREDDTIDVTAMTAGAIVNYIDGTIRDAAGVLHVTIEGIVDMERVIADGNDRVIVADADTMNNNARSDEGPDATPEQNILFMTYLDFDQLNTGATTRKSFSAQVAANEAQKVINQGQFVFSLSEVGVDADVDRVDYSAEQGRIVVPVGQGAWTAPGAATNKPQYVVVDGDNDEDFSNAESRVDQLWSVEEIVASLGPSVMDFTDVGQARQITFQYVAPSSNPADKAKIEQTIRVADGNGNALTGLTGFIERYTYNTGAPSAADDATWNQIEGSDASDVVIYQGSEDLVNQAGLDHRFTTDVLTLRGGANEVRYSPLETSITATITVTPEDTTTAGLAEGLIEADIVFQDGVGGALVGGGAHTITSHTQDNSTAAGSLKLEGSQDAEDTVLFAGLSAKTYILGTSPGVISVKIATPSGGTLDAGTLTGFEFLQDSASNDVYDFTALAATAGLTLVDTAGDHDTIKVGNDAAANAFNGGGGNTEIDLADLNVFFGFDFDVLDIQNVTLATVTTINGELLGLDDELVIGKIGNITTVNDFEALVVTNATIAESGTTFVLNTTANTLTAGAKTLTFNADMNNLSFNSTVFGATGAPTASTGVTVTVSGPDNVTIRGGSGADTITTAGGADSIRGGGGNDIIAAGFTAAVGEKAEVTLGGGGAVLAGVEVVALSGDGGVTTLFVGGSGSGATLTTASATADADQIGALLNAQTNAFLEANLGYAAGSIASHSYDAAANVFTINFTTAAGDVTDLTTAVTGGSTMTAAAVETAGTARVESADTYVFEATGAANGTDTLNNVDATDTFDFTAFIPGAAVVQGALFAAGAPVVVAGATDLLVVANKGTLVASDIVTVDANGKFTVADGDSVVFAMSADADGVSDASIQSWNLYYVTNGATAGTSDVTVTLVGTVNSDIELAAADIAGML